MHHASVDVVHYSDLQLSSWIAHLSDVLERLEQDCNIAASLHLQRHVILPILDHFETLVPRNLPQEFRTPPVLKNAEVVHRSNQEAILIIHGLPHERSRSLRAVCFPQRQVGGWLWRGWALRQCAIVTPMHLTFWPLRHNQSVDIIVVVRVHDSEKHRVSFQDCDTQASQANKIIMLLKNN